MISTDPLPAPGDDEPTINGQLMTSKLRTELAVFPEANVSGFAHYDQEIAFFTQVAALIRPSHVLLDFGAGRGEWFSDDPVRYRRMLQNFRGRVRHVDGCDIELTVKDNPTLDAAAIFAPGERLPYEDGRFDVIVSRYVFEHLADPAWAAAELMRVLKPGGWLCVVTPNKYGYIALASRLIPNRLHASMLRFVQPHRKEIDVFPTLYRLNTPRDIKRWFGSQADSYYYRLSGVPSYHFGRPWVLRILRIWHAILPGPLSTGLYLFLRKRP